LSKNAFFAITILPPVSKLHTRTFMPTTTQQQTCNKVDYTKINAKNIVYQTS